MTQRTMGDDDETFTVRFTEEEKEKARFFDLDTQKMVNEVRNLFPDTTRGMMLFMAVLHVFNREFQGLSKQNSPLRVLEWIAAGEPEDLSNIYERLKERGRDGQ